jgi:hypothetical protein
MVMRDARVALALVSCLGLAACAGGNAGTAPGPSASVAPAPQSGPPNMTYPYSAAHAPAQDQDAQPAAKPAPKPRNGSRAAYRNTTPAPAAAPEPDHQLSGEEQAMQTKTDCWMAVDRAKGVGNDIDKRMAWVDKCIADKKH